MPVWMRGMRLSRGIPRRPDSASAKAALTSATRRFDPAMGSSIRPITAIARTPESARTRSAVGNGRKQSSCTAPTRRSVFCLAQSTVARSVSAIDPIVRIATSASSIR